MSKKLIVPLLILFVGAAVTLALLRARPEVETVTPDPQPPLVRVTTVGSESVRLDVTSQGTVYPVTEAELVAEVAGTVTEISSSFQEGAFFRRGDVLLSIDARDYELAVESARAQVAQAEVQLALEQAEAEVAREEWQELGAGEPSPLTLRVPQLQEARARLSAAQATLAKAELDLERTRVTAPFDGRVRAQRADVGQFVNRGTVLGQVYSVVAAEVRLPVPDADLAFLDLALRDDSKSGPPVRLLADFAGERRSWEGRIVRTAGEIDSRTRMVTLIARVDDPYHRRGGFDQPPLAVGLFVEAVIEGRIFDDLAAIPRAALRQRDTVYVVDAEDRLHFRQVRVVRTGPDRVVIGEGLNEGDRLVLSPLDAPTEGMKVRTAGEEAATLARRGDS